MVSIMTHKKKNKNGGRRLEAGGGHAYNVAS